MEYYNKFRICDVCNTRFQEKNNLCKFLCGSHAGVFRNGKWLCCHDTNKTEKVNPCVRFDHYNKDTKFPTLKIIEKSTETNLLRFLTKILDPIISKKNSSVKVTDDYIYCKRRKYA